jgi:hypothetical protein
MLVKSESTVTLRQLYKNRDMYDYNWEIQRNEVWTPEKKSLLIHSFLYGYYVPNIIVMEEFDEDNERKYFVMDGKQRLSTIFGFFDEKFKLSDETPDIKGYKIAGMFFSDLPKELQDDFSDATITVVEYKRMSDDERDDFFFRLNNGMPLTKMEVARSLAGSKVLHFIKELKNEPFFAKAANIDDNARERFIDEELILQIMMLIENNCEPLELNRNEVMEYAERKREEGISNELSETMQITTEYLNEAFPVIKEKEKELKKSSIPMVFVAAIKAMQMGIEPLKFGGWVQSFFKRQPAGSEYRKAARSGSAKKENVACRLEIMLKDFEDQSHQEEEENVVKSQMMWLQIMKLQQVQNSKEGDTPLLYLF